MRFESRFVLEPHARVQSPWLGWVRSSAGAAELWVLQSSGIGGIEMSVVRRTDADTSTRHASLAISTTPSAHWLSIDPIEATQVRVEFVSHSDANIPLEFKLEDRPMI